MEYSPNHNKPYLAKAFYEHTVSVLDEYILTIDIGKFWVNDFFDVGIEVSDQTTQFLNQAINNNGAFDYAQDLEGHGYTYGFRIGLNNDLFGVDTAFFSSDSYFENIDKKYSVLVGECSLRNGSRALEVFIKFMGSIISVNMPALMEKVTLLGRTLAQLIPQATATI
jgi:hypothetical protein